MSFRGQVTFWAVALAVFLLVFWLLHGILLPFVAGMVLAYLLNPLATRLERIGLSRLLAALLIVALFVIAFVVLLLLIIPLIGVQLAGLIENLPGYVQRIQGVAADPNRPWLNRVLGQGVRDLDVGELVKQGAGWIAAFIRSLWSGGQALISIFSLLVITPVVTFYLLHDWHRMVATVDRFVPLQHRATVHELAGEINRAIAGFIRGQTLVCVALGCFYAVGLSLAGLNFGLLIGLASGFLSFIPYVGSMSGLILAVGVAIAQFWPEWSPILMVAGIFFVGQFLEGYVLSPKLVGESVGLHPVWVMFALFAFGYLFGFVGLLTAVPLAAAVAVLLRFALRQYRASALYTGVGSP